MTNPARYVRPQSQQRERDVINAAGRHALLVHEDPNGCGLTPYGIATCAASLAMVLTDPDHPSHHMLCEKHGLEPRDVEA